ncbi:hypothetical protein T07_7232 [Trichinella nelsoni]|uniref:Uncharacterized protein n=1 Tax=Trichinella nelsoni TaxID=6336 RepID=A0A0V0RJ07_9BILA|nr:hypothetical protein T07_7232 [Trichinella nelsoni]
MTFFDHKLPNKIYSNYIEKKLMQIKVLYVVYKDQPIALICVSAIVMQIKSATTPVNDPANECPAGFASGAAPLSQFPGAVERSTLPLACVGPLFCETVILDKIKSKSTINLKRLSIYWHITSCALMTALDNLHLILSRAQAYQVGGYAQPYLALTDNYKWSDNCP